MILNGFYFGLGLLLLLIAVMIVFGLLSILGIVFSTVAESIAEKLKKWYYKDGEIKN